jgi:hypothetical protein
MKTIHILFASALAVSALSTVTNAQDAPPRGDRPPGRPPMSPVVAALDANKDGEIDATEIANATAALKALDKNGDGKLSGDEIRPPRRDRGPGAPGGRGDRPRGERGAGDAEKKDAK